MALRPRRPARFSAAVAPEYSQQRSLKAVSGEIGSDTTYPVIASEAKQSRARRGSSARDCFVAQRAPRNDSRLSSQKTTHIAPTSSETALGAAAFDHAQWRVGQGAGAILLDDADAGAHEAAARPAAAQPRLADLALGMDRVAGKDRVLDIELHVQKGQAGVLHRRLHQKTPGKGVDECCRRQTLLD